MNKFGLEADYLDWAYGGLHIPDPLNRGSYYNVYDLLSFHPEDLKHNYIHPDSCIERIYEKEININEF